MCKNKYTYTYIYIYRERERYFLAVSPYLCPGPCLLQKNVLFFLKSPKSIRKPPGVHGRMYSRSLSLSLYIYIYIIIIIYIYILIYIYMRENVFQFPLRTRSWHSERKRCAGTAPAGADCDCIRATV